MKLKDLYENNSDLYLKKVDNVEQENNQPNMIELHGKKYMYVAIPKPTMVVMQVDDEYKLTPEYINWFNNYKSSNEFTDNFINLITDLDHKSNSSEYRNKNTDFIKNITKNWYGYTDWYIPTKHDIYTMSHTLVNVHAMIKLESVFFDQYKNRTFISFDYAHFELFHGTSRPVVKGGSFFNIEIMLRKV